MTGGERPLRGAVLATLVLATLGAEAREPRWATRQWSWNAAAFYEQGSFRTFEGGELLRDFRQRRLRLTLGLHGFVLSPNLAQFRLELDSYWDAYRQRAQEETGTLRFGGRAALRILPMGKVPTTVFVSRERFRLTGEEGTSPFLAGVPESSTSWGARARFRSSFLKGTELGVEEHRYEYAEPDQAASTDRRGFASWSGTVGAVQARLAADFRVRDYPGSGFRQDDQSAVAQARSPLGKGWQWSLNADAYRRTFRWSEADATTGLAATWSTSAAKNVGDGDIFEVVYRGSHADSDRADPFDVHLVDAKYVKRISESLTVYPLALYGYQTGGGTSVHSPQVGLGANFTKLVSSFDLAANGQATYAWLTGTGTSGEVRDTRIGLRVSVSAGHGRGTRLQKRLELGYSRNQVRTSVAADAGLPDLGTSTSGAGTQDQLRSRVTLGWTSGSFQTTASGEWQLLTADADAFSAGQRIELLRASLQVAEPRITLTLNGGDSKSTRPVSERTRYGTAYLSWNAFSILSLTGSASLDRTETADRKVVDVRTYSAGVGFGFVLEVRLSAYRTESTVGGGQPRKDEGLVFSVGRGFGGALPIFAGGSRRGVIR